MQITVISVGQVKEKFLSQAIAEYHKRISLYAKLEFIEVADEKAPENLSAAEMEQVKTKEGTRILAKIPTQSHVIALAIEGQSLSSEAFAQHLDKLATYGNSRITFVIGGSLGLSGQVLLQANELLSFSKMTFPHQLMKLILTEQIYRAFRINLGAPYHK